LRIFAAIHMGILPDAHYQGAQGSPVTTQLSSALLDHVGPWGLFLGFRLVGPILEGLLFRGLLLTAFVKHIPFWAATLLQALLFTAVHEDMSLALFFIAFGLITGAMVGKSNGLLAAILLHVFNNTLGCIGLISLHNK